MQELLSFIHGYIQELNQIQNIVQPTKTLLQDLWWPPHNNVIKLNFDASFNADAKTSIAMVLAQKNMGQIMGLCTLPFAGVQDTFVAEAWAWERDLIFSMEIGFHRIQVEGDSLLIIERVTSWKEDKSVLRLIFQSIIHLGENFEELTYHFVPRSVN